MRLLTYDSQDQLNLVNDLNDNVPPYAILSHTWGERSDEVVFDDVQACQGRDKAGYGKIEFCGKQAKRDGINHFWVDTCCINKNAHLEVDEAIVSMYQWYRNAQKCYVYLSDVTVNGPSKNQNTHNAWEASFRSSRWFTRGWTLQELLAPAVVEFYSREWQFLGTKETLIQQIHEITTIPLKALRGTPLSRFSVDERIRWSKLRRTTKIEDGAYCLLGMFNVFMPLIYGEGQNAFHRLQKEVTAKAGSDVGAYFSPRSNLHEHQYIHTKALGFRMDSAPPPEPRHFVGRVKEIYCMQDFLRPHEASRKLRRLVLGGTGGIGKSQLAFAYTLQHKNCYTSVIWLNATSQEELKASLRLAIQGIVSVEEMAQLCDEDVLARAHASLCDISHTQWLLVFDNHDHPERFNIDCYIPTARHGSVIITTRLPEHVSGEKLQVQPLSALPDNSVTIQTQPHSRRFQKGLDFMSTGAAYKSNLRETQSSPRFSSGKDARCDQGSNPYREQKRQHTPMISTYLSRIAASQRSQLLSNSSSVAVTASDMSSVPQNFVPVQYVPSLQGMPHPRVEEFPINLPCRLFVTLKSIGNEELRGKKDEAFVHEKVFGVRWKQTQFIKDCTMAVENFLHEIVGPNHRNYQNFAQFRIVEQLGNTIRDTVARQTNLQHNGNGRVASHYLKESRAEQQDYTLPSSDNRCYESVLRTLRIDTSSLQGNKLPKVFADILTQHRSSVLLLELRFFYTRYQAHIFELCANRSCTEDVRQTLLDARAFTKSAWFIPTKFLDSYFTYDLVLHLIDGDSSLNESEDWNQAYATDYALNERFARWICMHSTKLLAACILCEMSLLSLFHLSKSNKSDSNPPTMLDEVPMGFTSEEFKNFMSTMCCITAHVFKTHKTLPDPTIRSPDPRSYEHEECLESAVLPVIHECEIKSSDSGRVTCVRIHSDHHDFSADRDKLFALKKITRNSARSDFDRERQIFEKLAAVPHSHLTPFIASWTQSAHHYILLPPADQNLADFYKTAPSPILDSRFVTWLLKQMTGLASAIDHIHNLKAAQLGPIPDQGSSIDSPTHGYHHDLKPKNILIFGENLKISDFGTARIEQVLGNSPRQGTSYQTKRLLRNVDYEAPDYVLTGTASRAHDVFSLGCIYLELLVWVFGSRISTSVEKFHRRRLEETPNYDLVKTASFWFLENQDLIKCRLKNTVQDHIQNLRPHLSRTLAFEVILGVVEGMLRINIDPEKDENGRGTRPGRLNAKQVLADFEKALAQAKLDLEREGDNFFLRKEIEQSSSMTTARDLEKDNACRSESFTKARCNPNRANLVRSIIARISNQIWPDHHVPVDLELPCHKVSETHHTLISLLGKVVHLVRGIMSKHYPVLVGLIIITAAWMFLSFNFQFRMLCSSDGWIFMIQQRL